MKIRNKTRNTLLSDKCVLANTFFKRFKGLMGKKKIEPGYALVITPCNSIHMFFMRFPIDAVFVDKNNIVLYIVSIKPWHISKIVHNAVKVIELPVGTSQKSKTYEGDELVFEE